MDQSSVNLTLCFPRPSSLSSSSLPTVVGSSPSAAELPKSHILLKVDRFGWSANNVTYQALGEHPHFRYYDFHPAPTTSLVSPQTHGVVPVWGFGTVVASMHPKVAIGERLYGYFAPTRYLVLHIDEKDVNNHSMYVPRNHLPADRRVYNQILRCSTDPLYTPETEDLTMLYRPLFWTSFWCEDWLARSGYRGGCEYILISSASSKTAFCFAYCIRQRAEREPASGISSIRIIGLTSKGNLQFTKNLGLYDEVYEYDTFLSASATPFHSKSKDRWIYIDVAGNQGLNSRIYTHFGSPYAAPKLVAAVSLGMTNLVPGQKKADEIQWTTNTNPKNSSSTTTKPAPLASSVGFWPVTEQFFTPEWLAVLRQELSPSQMFSIQKSAWEALMKDCKAWVKLEYVFGGERVKMAYEAMVERSTGLGPDKGCIWSMWDANGEGEVVQAKL